MTNNSDTISIIQQIFIDYLLCTFILHGSKGQSKSQWVEGAWKQKAAQYKRIIPEPPTTEWVALYRQDLPCHWKYSITYATVEILKLNDRHMTSKTTSDSENLLLSKFTLRIRR